MLLSGLFGWWVFGQTRLLRWSVAALAHFFYLWGFFILATVYLEAYGTLFGPPWPTTSARAPEVLMAISIGVLFGAALPGTELRTGKW